MKKILSVTLAALMIALLCAPAFAADRTITFVQPSQKILDACADLISLKPYSKAHPYVFAKVEDGAVKYVEDPDGPYVYYSERYMTLDDIYETYWDRVPPERYIPDAYSEHETIADGETLVFAVFTNPAYNAHSATVFVNNVRLNPSPQDGFYYVKADRNLTIRVLEDDENGQPGLQKNMYNVAMGSGDGFNVKTLADEGYKAAPYGGEFNFRIKIKKGYTASAMKVGLVRDVPEENFMEDFDSVGNIMNRNEMLTSVGVDADGCRLYKVTNVTSNCKIVVTGVREDKKAEILTMLLKILRKILDFLGVQIAFVDDMTNEYIVSVDNQASGVTYNFLSGGTANEDGTLSVMSGNSVTLQVIKRAENQNVSVNWTEDDNFTYATNWVGKREASTGETIFVATYNIDSIKADTVIRIR